MDKIKVTDLKEYHGNKHILDSIKEKTKQARSEIELIEILSNMVAEQANIISEQQKIIAQHEAMIE